MSIQGIMSRRGQGALREDYKMVEVILSSPRGFCAGVVRAIDVVEECLERFGPPRLRQAPDRAQPVRRRRVGAERSHHGGGGR